MVHNVPLTDADLRFLRVILSAVAKNDSQNNCYRHHARQMLDLDLPDPDAE